MKNKDRVKGTINPRGNGDKLENKRKHNLKTKKLK